MDKKKLIVYVAVGTFCLFLLAINAFFGLPIGFGAGYVLRPKITALFKNSKDEKIKALEAENARLKEAVKKR